MVWQVLEGLSRDSAKRLRFVPGVIYVDASEGAVCGQSHEDREKTLAQVKLTLQKTGLPWHVVALEEVGVLGPLGVVTGASCTVARPDHTPWQVFSLPSSVLRGSALDPAGTQGGYKAAVGSFLQQQQQQHAPVAEPSPSPAPGEARLCQPHTWGTLGHQGLAELPTAAQTQALCRLFDSVRTLTAKEELLQTLRSHLVLHVARAHGYSKVMTGDSCTRLAIKLVTNLALGRGAFLAWDTGFSDERQGDVVLVRPMCNHTLKEVAFYNRLFAVPSVLTPALGTKAPEKASVHRLVEAFMLRLQTQFPSTVSTVCRTGEKLLKAPRSGPAGPPCLLCACTLDVDTADSATAFGAQIFSCAPGTQLPSLLARAGEPQAPSSSPGESGAQGCCREACKRDEHRACVVEQLCYGCRANLRDLPSLDPLPPYILAEAQLRSQRAWVQQQIQEYLIEDSEDDAAETGHS
ncbi:cytoplasmic tRNA 2-thiolation protein 2 isoform X1 [Tupaia chinensis]|uniref:cytoplasmic tRNA 2-thiolation protein 2 isoform X1 n=1 Tax=Tupaia chinensis TaxID=246437 RepID=UPI000FFB8CCD|nr:cytoplasmic tRNA 2-thiolation protein 2 isoform X1 [Tupaia chinensis]